MNRCHSFTAHHSSQLRKRHALGLFWIAGLLAGGFFFLFGAERLVPLMLVFLRGNVSIVLFFCLIFLPPFLSILAASTRMRGLLYIIAFGRAFLYSFASVALLISFGSAGWLVRFLLCFSGFFSSPFLYWLWLCCLRAGSGPSSLEVFFFVSVLLLIGCIDYRLIMPFWADLYF